MFFLPGIGVAIPPLEVSKTRLVCQLTGKGSAGIVGQDAAIILPWKNRILLFFGDTKLSSGGMIPNSMAETFDFRADDCVDLFYLTGGDGVAREPLKKEGKEATVWIHSVFSDRDEIYAFYYTVSPHWPSEPASFGTGLARSKDGGKSFSRTGLRFSPDSLFREIIFALPYGEYIYILLRNPRVGFGSLYLARVKKRRWESAEAYEVWDGKRWVKEEEKAQALFDNAGGTSIQWNAYLGKWLAVYTAVFSGERFLSEIQARTADKITGPWSAPVVLVQCPVEPKREWGSCYAAQHNSVWDAENGKIIYVTASDWLSYNVFLYEVTLK
ncbi:MAG: DUF4185 domain-containing protein [bacterium JZ-2024 1]